MNEKHCYTKVQLLWLVILRVLIGWYFLYEGVSKVFTTDWTSYGYLMDSKGLFAPFFTMLPQHPALLSTIDAVNIYGLILIGLLLILGCFERVGYIGAIALISLYYLSHPALISATYAFRPEGSYLWVDKNTIMLCAVAVLMVFPTAREIGLDRFIFRKIKKQ